MGSSSIIQWQTEFIHWGSYMATSAMMMCTNGSTAWRWVRVLPGWIAMLRFGSWQHWWVTYHIIVILEGSLYIWNWNGMLLICPIIFHCYTAMACVPSHFYIFNRKISWIIVCAVVLTNLISKWWNWNLPKHRIQISRVCEGVAAHIIHGSFQKFCV